MRWNSAWTVFSVPAVLMLGALSAGCDSSTSVNPEAAKQQAQLQKESLEKGQATADAIAKKTGATVKFMGKPGAAGANK
jgi:hypothetical protein